MTFISLHLVTAAAKSLQSCPTLCDPIDGSPLPSLGFSRQEHWNGLPFPSPMHESEREVAQSRLTLRDPMDCSPPGSSVHGIFQARVLEWGVITFSAGLMTSWQIEGEIMETMRDFIFLGSKITADGVC